MPPAHSSSRRQSHSHPEFEGTIRTRRNSVTIEFPSGFRVIAESLSDSRPAQPSSPCSPPPQPLSPLAGQASRTSAERGRSRRPSRHPTPDPYRTGSLEAVFVAAGISSFPLELGSNGGFVEDSSISDSSGDSPAIAPGLVGPPTSGLRGGNGERQPPGDHNRRNVHPNGQSPSSDSYSNDSDLERMLRQSRCPLLRLLFSRRRRHRITDNYDRQRDHHRR
ncbi:hypothetical protein GGR57DRAFT_482379 [Xylariaceae sp. FL1272]|nr:hypothetical protein GGR57DRAFT_482379 [Xylariaceae sp. FL1272]